MFLIISVGMVLLILNLKNASLAPLDNWKWPPKSKMTDRDILDTFTHKLTWKADSWQRSLWYIFMGAVSQLTWTLYMAITERYAGKMRQENPQIKPSD